MPSDTPGSGIFSFMIFFKIILGIEGIIAFVLPAIYIAGLYSYQDKTMPYALQPSLTFIPYWPVDSSSDEVTDTNFYYGHAARSQIALGALTFLHAACATIVACCCLKHNLKRAGIVWFIAGTLNAITAAVAAGWTFIADKDSKPQYPNAANNTIQHWTYGHYSPESWVCGQGKYLVGLMQPEDNGQPLGGSTAVSDFSHYCKEAEGAKWMTIVILITSIIMMGLGIMTCVKSRKISKMERGDDAYNYSGNAYGASTTEPQMASYNGAAYGSTSSGAPLASYSSGEEGYEAKKPVEPTSGY